MIFELWIDAREIFFHISELGIIVYVVVRPGGDQHLDNQTKILVIVRPRGDQHLDFQFKG